MSGRATSLVEVTRSPAEATATAREELARSELLSFPAALLAELPMHVRISVQISGFAHSITIDTSCERPPTGKPNGLVFDGEELRALAVAVQAERMWPADFKGFCLHKLHDQGFRLTQGEALAGAQPSVGAAWPLGRVLRWLELELIGFACSDDATPVRHARSDIAAA